MDPMQKILDFANKRVEEWEAAANRAEIRGEKALAIYFRNQSWRIANGREWIDDISIEGIR